MGIFKSLFGGNKLKEDVYSELSEMGFGFDKKKLAKAFKMQKKEFKKQGIKFYGSDFELICPSLAVNSLPRPFEGYANDVAKVFTKKLDADNWETPLREIGKKINDNHRQMLVAYRAQNLCRENYENGNEPSGDFSIRYLEIAWDGLGGWMK